MQMPFIRYKLFIGAILAAVLWLGPNEPPYTGPYVWWCGRGKPRGFLLPDRLVMSDSTGSFTLTSLRDAGFLRRICYYSARHEAGAVNPICLLKALASCSYGWVVSDTRS